MRQFGCVWILHFCVITAYGNICAIEYTSKRLYYQLIMLRRSPSYRQLIVMNVTVFIYMVNLHNPVTDRLENSIYADCIIRVF